MLYSNDTSHVEASCVVFHGSMTFNSLSPTFYASSALVNFLVQVHISEITNAIVMILHMWKRLG